MKFRNTRDNENRVTASHAIIKGLGEGGGLFVPDSFPSLAINDSQKLNFQQLAEHILRLYLGDEPFFLDECVRQAYNKNNFSAEEIVPIVQSGEYHFIELFHGKTLAFKDIALSILPYLITDSMRIQDQKEDVVILAATSGDTGKAAMAGFSDVPRTKIIVFYPESGVSDIQKLQMLTQTGGNVNVIGIRGNFDDAQTGVKELFRDENLNAILNNHNLTLSSANSINIGRLLPQIVYYYHAYNTLLKDKVINVGDCVDITVPTGNFGNILAVYYAKKMGLPVRKIICASNDNNVLYDFIKTGTYDIEKRSFLQTTSPSMDILISSNLERLIFDLVDADASVLKSLYESLATDKKFNIPIESFNRLSQMFDAGWASEDEVSATISSFYRQHNYLIDTHTAVALKVASEFKEDKVPMLIASTASPFKFPEAVAKAIGLEVEGKEGSSLNLNISATAGVDLPQSLKELASLPVLHKNICDISEMREKVENFLSI